MYFGKAGNKRKHVQNCSYLTLSPRTKDVVFKPKALHVGSSWDSLSLPRKCMLEKRSNISNRQRKACLKNLKLYETEKVKVVPMFLVLTVCLSKGIARYHLLLNIIVLAIQNWPGNEVTHFNSSRRILLLKAVLGLPLCTLSCCNNNLGLKLSQKKTKARGRYSPFAHGKAQDSSPSSRIWACTQWCKIPAVFTCPPQPAGEHTRGHRGNF